MLFNIHKRLKSRGWNAPPHQPFKAVGEFTQVYSAIEGVKEVIPHAGEMKTETQKYVNKMKRANNPVFKCNKSADRTHGIL